MIGVSHLSKEYGKCKAVTDISFTLMPGTIGGFLGPNGAGKTTAINMMAGLLNPTSGEILYKNKRISDDPISWKSLFGVVPEDPILFHRLTLFEHITLAGKLYDLSEKETRQRGEGLFEYLGLKEYGDTIADEASMGMKKKCALAMALIHKPDILICWGIPLQVNALLEGNIESGLIVFSLLFILLVCVRICSMKKIGVLFEEQKEEMRENFY
jgi:ABC-2 type transport system ATP-binding protein